MCINTKQFLAGFTSFPDLQQYTLSSIQWLADMMDTLLAVLRSILFPSPKLHISSVPEVPTSMTLKYPAKTSDVRLSSRGPATVCSRCSFVRTPAPEPSTPSLNNDVDDGCWVPMQDFLAMMPLYTSHEPIPVVWSHGLCSNCYEAENKSLDAVHLEVPEDKRACLAISTAHTTKDTKGLAHPHTASCSTPPPFTSRVLVVDDNQLQRKIVKRMVQRAGFRCDLASNGDEAIELVKANTYCLILMDCVMGATDGWTTASMIRNMEQDTQTKKEPKQVDNSTKTLIVALTGLQTGDALMSKCLEAGMNEVIHKPIDECALRKLLKKIEK
jgi:CheY-like chemotaxis protein